MQALLEGVALRTAEAIGAIHALQPIRTLSVDGGMARNGYLLDFLAGLLPQSTARAAEVESTALGLAHMALAADGQPVPDMPMPVPVTPRSGESARAGQRLARFAQIREGLTRLSHEIKAPTDA